MDALETLFTRRSIRKFTDQDVSDESLHTMLKAAMLAPSACNAQPWRFIVIRSQDGRDAVARCNPHAHMAKDAPLCVIVCADLKAEKSAGYWPQDCAAALQNFMLAARALGIGTVWTGIYPKEDRVPAFHKTFGLPENIMPLGAVIVGYPAEEFKEEDRFDSSKIYNERWGQ